MTRSLKALAAALRRQPAILDVAWPLRQVYSGGQTGADQAALRAAQHCRYSTGGMAPKGWRTDDGPAPWLGSVYGLIEGTEASYGPRTEWNALNSSGTLWFGNVKSPGGILTQALCVGYNKPFEVVDLTADLDSLVTQLRRWIVEKQIVTLNGAGNRERTNPGIGARTETILRGVLTRLQHRREIT